MIYLERKPGLLLRPWIHSFWYCRAPVIAHRRERVLPNGHMQIVINLARNYLLDCAAPADGVRQPRSIVLGVRDTSEVIDTSDLAELVGIVFRPGGFSKLFAENASLFFGLSVDTEAIWNADVVGRLSEAFSATAKLAALEELLAGKVPERASACPVTSEMLLRLRDPHCTISACARAIGLSERRISQIFRQQVGTAPKTWLRIRRFQAAVRGLHAGLDVRWAELALQCGYYDQSHFANDFHAFSGVNPTTYSALRGRWQNHIPVI